MYSWFYLGVNGKVGLQAAVSRGGFHLSETEVDTSNLLQVRRNNVGVLSFEAYGKHQWEYFGEEPGGGYREREGGIPTGFPSPEY